MPRYKYENGIRKQLTAEEEAAREIEEDQAIKNQIQVKSYASKRKNAYPEIGDQLDMLWHSINENAELKQKYFAFYEAIKAVKAKYPK